MAPILDPKSTRTHLITLFAMLTTAGNAATKQRTARFLARHGQAVEAALARAINKLAVSDAHADETDTNVVVKWLGEEVWAWIMSRRRVRKA